jgi:hypothetical protein
MFYCPVVRLPDALFKAAFPNLFSKEEPLRYIFIFRGTPTYENVYRPQKVDSGKRKSIAARLLSGKFYVKICYILYIYSRFLEEPLTMFCGNPGFLGTLVGKHCFKEYMCSLHGN